MLEIIISSMVLSIIHAIIPNHWIPIVIVAKTEKWSWRQSFFATLFSGFAHTLSTVLIGIVIGFAGYKLSERYTFISHQLAPIILIVLGLFYIIIDSRYIHHHSHHHNDMIIRSKSSRAILISISLSMFLTPCTEIEAYYFKAGSIGWAGIMAVSIIYVVITIMSMIFLVYAGMTGIKKIRFHYLEHHEKLITGLVLVVLGVFALFNF